MLTSLWTLCVRWVQDEVPRQALDTGLALIHTWTAGIWAACLVLAGCVWSMFAESHVLTLPMFAFPSREKSWLRVSKGMPCRPSFQFESSQSKFSLFNLLLRTVFPLLWIYCRGVVSWIYSFFYVFNFPMDLPRRGCILRCSSNEGLSLSLFFFLLAEYFWSASINAVRDAINDNFHYQLICWV